MTTMSDPSIPLASVINTTDILLVDQVDASSVTGYRTRRVTGALLATLPLMIGAFAQADTYAAGVGANTGLLIAPASPTTLSSAVAVFQSITNITSGSGVTIYASLVKENSAAGIENHVIHTEAVDAAGGGSIAGGRFTSALLGGTGGNGTGSTNVSLSTVPYAFVVGAENQVWLGAAATEATTTFSKNAFACGVLSSCSWSYSADAGFLINPNGYTAGHGYITGFMIPSAGGSAGNDPVIDSGFRCDANCVYGADLSRGTYSGGAIKASGFLLDNSGNVTGNTFKVGANQVVGARLTGWTVATGTPSRATFATAGVTLATLAGVVMALEQDLIAHGLIGT